MKNWAKLSFDQFVALELEEEVSQFIKDNRESLQGLLNNNKELEKYHSSVRSSYPDELWNYNQLFSLINHLPDSLGKRRTPLKPSSNELSFLKNLKLVLQEKV